LLLNFENFGRVLELLINFEKASTSPVLKKCREIRLLTVLSKFPSTFFRACMSQKLKPKDRHFFVS